MDEVVKPIENVNKVTPNTSNGSQPAESSIFGVSVRGLIALLLVITVSAMALIKIEMDDKLFSLVVAVVSFYFGKTSKSAS